MCHLPRRNIRSRSGSSLLGCINNPNPSQQMNKKLNWNPFRSRMWTSPFITWLHLTHRSLSGPVRRLMFSHGNSRRVFSVCVHHVASHTQTSVRICLWSAAQESQQDCNFLCNSAHTHTHTYTTRPSRTGECKNCKTIRITTIMKECMFAIS